jgi:transcriptional regulator with XRE-family HTH domain
MTVSDLIRELREARSLSQPQLARRSRIARSHLWGIENGRFVPGITTLQRISDSLGVGVGRLLTKSESEMLLEDPFVKNVQLLLARLSVQHRQQILKTLEAAPKKFPRP